MQRIFIFILAAFLCSPVFAQQKDFYIEQVKKYQKNYVDRHEVVKKKDKKYFRFFPISSMYNVNCSFQKINDKIGFTMKTSANTLKHYYTYGRLHFKIAATDCKLFVYQSKDLMQTEEYRNYLFVPFTDLTTAVESYGSGRYLEFFIPDIQNNILQLDFNRAYNPYCAYSPDYKCPIPPVENRLTVPIKAGEMNFGKRN